MSLLDDVSIVVTPNGYKAGELYAVKPTYALGSEVMTNGVFNADDTSSWNGFYDSFTFTTDHYNLQRTAGDARVRKIFSPALIIGNMYIVEVVAKSASGDNILVGVTNSGDIQTELAVKTTSSSYQSFTHTFIAGANTTYATLWNDDGNSNVDYQSYSIKQVTSADMDVTRATAATRVDEAGLVNYAEVLGSELVVNGDFATDLSGWTLSNTNATNTIVWNSGKALMTADGSIALLLRQSAFEIGKTYIIELDAYNITGAGFKLFDGGEYLKIQSDGHYTVYHTALTLNFDLYRFQSGVASSGEFDNISVKEITRDNVPRIDYSGGGCPHILAEPQRTNEVTYSEDFSNSYFQKIRSTISTDQISSPDGTQNADKFIEDSSNNTHLLWTQDYVVSIGDSLTWSVFAKKGERDFIVLQESNAGNFYAFFDLDNGVIGTTSGVDSSKIEDLGSGWYRCSITYTTTGTTAKGRLYLADSNNSQSYQGNGTSGLYIWGAQLEKGSFPTSYIPTSGSTVTRNQDIFSRDGIASLINSEEGVLFMEMAALSDDGTGRYISISDGGTQNVIRFYFSTNENQIVARYYVGNSVQSNFSHTLTDATIFNKIAFKYKENDFALWVNGVEVGTDTSGTVNLANTFTDINFNFAGANNFFGKVKQLQVYKTALTDTQLAALTS